MKLCSIFTVNFNLMRLIHTQVFMLLSWWRVTKNSFLGACSIFQELGLSSLLFICIFVDLVLKSALWVSLPQDFKLTLAWFNDKIAIFLLDNLRLKLLCWFDFLCRGFGFSPLLYACIRLRILRDKGGFLNCSLLFGFGNCLLECFSCLFISFFLFQLLLIPSLSGFSHCFLMFLLESCELICNGVVKGLVSLVHLRVEAISWKLLPFHIMHSSKLHDPLDELNGQLLIGDLDILVDK